MSGVKSLVSTLFHVGLEKMGLDMTTKALILPHVPTVLDLCSNMTNVAPKIEPYYNQISYLLFFIVIFYAIYRYWYLITNHMYQTPVIPHIIDDTLHIKVANDLDAQSILYYLINNSHNTSLMRDIKISRMEVRKNAAANNYKMMEATSEQLYNSFMKATYITPSVLDFNYTIDKKKYGVDSLNMVVKVNEIEVKEEPEEPEDSESSNKKKIKKISEEKKESVFALKNTIDMNIYIKGLSDTNGNGISFYKDFCDTIKKYLEQQKVKEFGITKTLNKLFIGWTKKEEADRFTISSLSGLFDKKDNQIAFHVCPKNSTFDDRINMYMRTFINQSSPDIERMLYELKYQVYDNHINPISQQNPTISLLIHGPPGSGKSTIPVIMAKVFERNIVYLSIDEFPNIKDLRDALIKHRTRDNVLVLDEFDKFIVKLIEDKKRPILPPPSPSHNTNSTLKDNDKKKNDKSKNKSDIMDFELEIEKDMDTINDNVNVKEMAQMFDHQHLAHLHSRRYNYGPEDLLSLFDDTCKVPGSITIATTNNPDVIVDIGTGKTKGAMVRSGRLKLFRLGYFDRESVQRLFDIKWKHSVPYKEEWFGDNGEIKIQNSNFMDILRESSEENIYNNIEAEIANELLC